MYMCIYIYIYGMYAKSRAMTVKCKGYFNWSLLIRALCRAELCFIACVCRLYKGYYYLVLHFLLTGNYKIFSAISEKKKPR